jgi:hypothetical protein
MYPLHTGSVLLDITNSQRSELIGSLRDRRHAKIVQRHATAKPSTRRPKRRPWWWGLARSQRAA